MVPILKMRQKLNIVLEPIGRLKIRDHKLPAIVSVKAAALELTTHQ